MRLSIVIVAWLLANLLSFFLGVSAGRDKTLRVSGYNQEIRVQGPVTTVIFDEHSFGNMVISDKGEVKQ